MEHIKRIGAGFLDTLSASSNKPPPDDLLVSCKKQLTDLRDEIMVVKQQFSQYAHQVVEAAEASVTLSMSVEKFYSRANHPGRSESVNMYKKVQEEIANRAVNTFHITVENGLVSELSEWVQLIANLTEKIQNAESTRITAHDIQTRLTSLETEFQDKKVKKQGLFGGNRENELEDLQQRINESSEAQKSLSIEYQKSRNSVAQSVKQLMEKRYRYFDRIYVQMLECQQEYFQHAANVSKRFQRDIDYYRKQYPKHKEFQHSNGSLHRLAAQIQSEKKAENPDDNDSNNDDEDITINATRPPPKVPTTRPPPVTNAQKIQEPLTETITNSSTQSPNTSDASSTGRSSPVHTDKEDEMKKAMSSPPITQQNGAHMVTGVHMHKQQSTHDILGFGTMSPQTAPPKPQKQESLLTAMFGNTEAVAQKNTGHKQSDPHGIFNLANPDHNDMLHGFAFADDTDKKQQTQKVAQRQSVSNNPDPNDIFDFMGSFGSHNGTRPHHGSQDSTTDWILASHNPAEPEKKRINGNDTSLEQQMNDNFNQPSYGGGHGHGQSNHQQNKQSSPKIKNSTTGNIDGDGTSVNVNKQGDISQEDKAKMAQMELSHKGRENAQRAYDEAMSKRHRAMSKMEDEEKEKEYWKDKHENTLVEWEFDNGVRRNVRTLIGKLPDVLPANLHWTPIPMTKLLNDSHLKKAYFKAVRVVHPDKSIGRGDSIENQVVCDYVFQALEQAFNTKFG